MAPEKCVTESHQHSIEPKGRTTRESPSAGGFSLIEMIIVVAILGIVCAIAIPSFQRYAVNGNLRSAARDIVSDFNALKGRAMAENREYRLSIVGNQYTIQARDPGPDGIFGTADDGAWGDPPPGVTTPKTPASFARDITMSPDSTYTFQARGIVNPGGTITFANSRGSMATVAVNTAGRTSAQFTMR